MSCIDFTHKIEIITLRKISKCKQWKIAFIPQGDYYSDTNKNIKPNCLGINDYQENKSGSILRRIKHTYELQKDIEALQSVALGVLDTWSVKSMPIQTRGGCIQYFNSNDKPDFKQIKP